MPLKDAPNVATGPGALAYAQPGTYQPGSAGFDVLMGAPFFKGRQGVQQIGVQPGGDFAYSVFGPRFGSIGKLAGQLTHGMEHLPLVGGDIAKGEKAMGRGNWVGALLDALKAGGKLGGLVSLGSGIGTEIAGGEMAEGGTLGEQITELLKQRPDILGKTEFWKTLGPELGKLLAPTMVRTVLTKRYGEE